MAYIKQLDVVKGKLNGSRLCNIVYVPLSGGNLIAQIFSTAFNDKGEHYTNLYKTNKDPWVLREYKFGLHEKIGIVPSFQVRFKDLHELDQIVFIDCRDIESQNLLKWRHKFIHQSVMNDNIMHLHFNYHNEMFYYMQKQGVPHMALKFYEFFDNRKIFVKRIMHIAKLLKISLDKSTVSDIHNAWLDSNNETYDGRMHNKYEDVWHHWAMKDKYF